MAAQRIIAIDLDEASIPGRSADLERERQVAIIDLLAANSFTPLRAYQRDYVGPYRIRLRVEDGRLAIDIADQDGQPLERLVLAMTRFRRTIRDYFAICDSYFAAIRTAPAGHVETVDMARRALHNDGAAMLMDRLKDRITLDFDTARRLFTLICVLHIRG